MAFHRFFGNTDGKAELETTVVFYSALLYFITEWTGKIVLQ